MLLSESELAHVFLFDWARGHELYAVILKVGRVAFGSVESCSEYLVYFVFFIVVSLYPVVFVHHGIDCNCSFVFTLWLISRLP